VIPPEAEAEARGFTKPNRASNCNEYEEDGAGRVDESAWLRTDGASCKSAGEMKLRKIYSRYIKRLKYVEGLA
jgi:hypothetical protein